MYYYIFDPANGPKEQERTAEIKEYLSTIGIAGEITQPQPGRTVEQLVETAISKRYSTVIAVGGIELINRIAGCLAERDVVFGIIPLVEHEDIRSLIGVTEWKAAADQLKRRRWGVCRVGAFSNGEVFLTPAHLDLGVTHTFRLSTADFSVTGSGGLLTISATQDGEQATLLVEFSERTPEKKRWWQQFSKQGTESPFSQFPLVECQIETTPVLPIIVAGMEITHTPTTITIEQKSLKLIAARS